MNYVDIVWKKTVKRLFTRRCIQITRMIILTIKKHTSSKKLVSWFVQIPTYHVCTRVAVPGSRDFGLKSTSRFPGNFSFPSRELNNSSMMLFIQQS